MLEYTYYWSLDDRRESPMKMRPVLVKGYREVGSMEHFRHKQCGRIPYEMFLKYKSYDIYGAVPHCQMLPEIEDWNATYARLNEEHPELNGTGHRYVIEDESIRMHDFFIEIGYNYKTKKFNGITMKRKIINYMKRKS